MTHVARKWRNISVSYHPSIIPRLFPLPSPNLILLTIRIDHCLDILRQSLSCYSDLSPLLWSFNTTTLVYSPTWPVVRQCRNFEKVREWVTERNTTGSTPGSPPRSDKKSQAETRARLEEYKRQGIPFPWEATARWLTAGAQVAKILRHPEHLIA